MNFSILSCSFAMLVALCCTSCSDPELVEKREKQKAELVRLKGELALVSEKLKNLPPDVTAQLVEAKKLSEKQTGEVTALETEIAALETKKKSLQSEFDVYKLKYQVK
jgi:septal ring factor EnvC (AmiA/AmiB activator)